MDDPISLIHYIKQGNLPEELEEVKLQDKNMWNLLSLMLVKEAKERVSIDVVIKLLE